MTGRERNYSHEHKLRQKRAKRLHADIERDKAERFKGRLQGRGETFASWLNNQIDKEMKGPK